MVRLSDCLDLTIADDWDINKQGIEKIKKMGSVLGVSV